MNGMRVLVVACACLAVAAIVRASELPSMQTARAHAASQVKDLHPDDSLLLELKQFQGERVLFPVLNFEFFGVRPVAPAAKLLGRLQNFCEAYTPKDKGDKPDMIPFGVRGTWVVAPEWQPVINFDYRFIDPKMARSRNAALVDAVLDIPDSLLSMAGSDHGIAVSALPAAVQSSLLTALHPPLTVETRIPYVGSSPPEQVKPIIISEALNPASIQFRMRLRNSAPMVRGNSESGQFAFTMPVAAAQQPTLEVNVAGDLGGVNLEAVRFVPNRYKPTDLDGSRYTQPLGIQGCQNVSSILERVEKVTGLKVHASAPWAGIIIYVGSDAITCGEALDAVRLIFTGSWRKVGSVYLLCWDREGLRRLQYRWNKSATPVIEAVKAEEHTPRDERWLTIAMQVPFAPDDPLRWTDEQRQTMLGPVPDDKKPASLQRQPIYYSAMTPSQQAAVRLRQTMDETKPPPKPTPNPPLRPLREDEWVTVALSSNLDLDVEVKISGLGWVRLQIAYPASLDASMLDQIRAIHRNIARSVANPQTQPVYRFPTSPWGYSNGEPDAKDKAVMVRAVSPYALPGLAKSLKALGVSTLIYPILHNGYASLPGTPFPVDPALKGANGWAAAVKAGNAAGLRVLGSINVLEWRNRGATTHWLDARRDLLDIDEFGQTRLQWLAGLGAAGMDYRLGTAIGGDLVRLASSEVSTRLGTVIDVAARTPGAFGIVFDRWEQSPDLNRLGLRTLPAVGYGETDRVASILQQGKDPLDERATILSFLLNWEGVPTVGPPRMVGVSQRSFAPIGRRSSEAAPVKPPESPESLLGSLIQRARKAAPTWKTGVVKEGENSSGRYSMDSSQSVLPLGDVTLYTLNGTPFRNAPNWLVRVPSKDAVGKDPKVPPATRQWQSIAVPLAEQMRFNFGARTSSRGFAMVVYDFRAAIEDPVVSLKWLKEQTAKADKARADYIQRLRESGPATGSPKG